VVVLVGGVVVGTVVVLIVGEVVGVVDGGGVDKATGGGTVDVGAEVAGLVTVGVVPGETGDAVDAGGDGRGGAAVEVVRVNGTKGAAGDPWPEPGGGGVVGVGALRCCA